MLSAPAIIPANSVSTFAAGFAPALFAAPLMFTRSATSPGNPTRSANPTACTRPASP